MKQMKKKLFALLAVLALVLGLLTACGGDGGAHQQPDAPAPSSGEAAPSVPEDKAPEEDKAQEGDKAPVEEPVKDEEPTPAEEPAPAEDPAPNEEPPAEEPAPETQPASAPAEPEPEPEPEPDPAPEPEPEPEPEPAETAPEDGTYTASVKLEGGSGRATVESPATLYCNDGQFTAVIVWSSPNFDYMKVDGQRYDQTNTEGNSTFEIPVAAFDQALNVIADTVAMSEPHEVEYTLTFDSATLQKQ